MWERLSRALLLKGEPHHLFMCCASRAPAECQMCLPVPWLQTPSLHAFRDHSMSLTLGALHKLRTLPQASPLSTAAFISPFLSGLTSISPFLSRHLRFPALSSLTSPHLPFLLHRPAFALRLLSRWAVADSCFEMLPAAPTFGEELLLLGQSASLTSSSVSCHPAPSAQGFFVFAFAV